MHLKNTAKFGANNNGSIMDRYQTQITEHLGRSQMLIKGEQSQMNLSDLEASKGDFIILNGVHRIPQNPETTYRCPICERLRAICPSKNYKTYEYCQRCTEPVQGKRTRPKIFNSVGYTGYGGSKDLNSTYNETKGVSTNQLSNGLKQMQEVNKVRFVQSNNVYPLKAPTSNHETFRDQSAFQQERKRATSTYEFQRPAPVNHQVIKEQVHVPTQVRNVQEIIFYPVIHNKVVYRSANRNDQSVLGQDTQMGRSRCHSHYGGNKNKRMVEKVVSDFLHTTQPDEVLTPSQFKKLADSIYREQNPNLEQEINCN